MLDIFKKSNNNFLGLTLTGIQTIPKIGEISLLCLSHVGTNVASKSEQRFNSYHISNIQTVRQMNNRYLSKIVELKLGPHFLRSINKYTGCNTIGPKYFNNSRYLETKS